MDLTAEQIAEFGVSEEQATKINTWSKSTIDEKVASTKKEYDGLANTNAENILSGASAKIFDITKVERNQGEKVADYIVRSWDTFNTDKLTGIKTLKTEYKDKIANFKGNDDLITKITTLEGEKDGLLQKFATFDEIKEKAEKYDPLFEKYEQKKKEVAFNEVKPNFPKEANQYEVSAKWKAFKDEVLSKYDLEIVDGKPIAIDKENEHRRIDLSSLLEKDQSITDLLKGRQQLGPGAISGNLSDIEGVPFKVPEGADAEVRTGLIKEYLTKTKGLSPMSTEYSLEFSKINSAIINKK